MSNFHTYGFVLTRRKQWWSSFISKWYGSLMVELLRFIRPRSYSPIFFSFFCIVSRPTKQRHQIGYHCEKVFFDMHSGRLSICSISTDVTFVTDFTVNRPVWPSNTLAIKHMNSFGVRKGRLSLNMIDSCWHWNQANRYEGLSNNRLINQLIANVRYLLVRSSTHCSLVRPTQHRRPPCKVNSAAHKSMSDELW